MKTRNLVIILFSVLVLNSCIVKSLHPFYIQEAISFEEKFVGDWKDNKGAIWHVESFKAMFDKEFNSKNKPSKEDLAAFEKYKYNYYVEYTSNDKKAAFMATPFKVKNQLLLDFTPYIQDDTGLNSLLSSHLINAHSVVKFDMINNDNVDIKWLDENRIKDLFKNSKIRIKHETIGIQEDFLLTADSKELYEFLEKYLASSVENKWKSTSDKKLSRYNVKP